MIETDPGGAPFEVDDLDAATLLAHAADAEAAARVADRRKLRLAAQWCVLHPATAETGAASWGDVAIGGLTGVADDETLGGEGTPAVAAFSPEPLGAALGVSTASATSLMADVLDLDHIDSYNKHGPPGQTTPANLAPLCRRHHRAKPTAAGDTNAPATAHTTGDRPKVARMP
jgi:hypothetical protein